MLAGRQVNILLAQYRTWGACLLPLVQRTTFTGNELAVAMTEALFCNGGIETKPFLLRSDRGGADGAASRTLALSWGVAFLSCLAHIFSNIIEEYEASLLAVGNPLIRLHGEMKKAFFGEKDGSNGRAMRWKNWQETSITSVKTDKLRKLTTELLDEVKYHDPEEAACAVYEALDDAAACFTERVDFLEQAKLQLPATTMSPEDFVARLEETSKERSGQSNAGEHIAPLRMPLGSDTKYLHRFEFYSHLQQRLHLFPSFIADELASHPDLRSLQEIATLLPQVPEADIQAYIASVLPLFTLLQKYSDQVLVLQAHKVFFEVQTAITTLLGGVNVELGEVFERRWKQPESGRDFYTVARLLDPNQLRAVRRKGAVMSYEAVCDVLPVFKDLPEGEACWTEYVQETNSVVAEGKLENFWNRYPNTDLATLALDILYVSPSCTLTDSVLSIGESLFPDERSALNNQSLAELLFHKANGDLLEQLPKSKFIRRGYPGNVPDTKAKKKAPTNVAEREVISLD